LKEDECNSFWDQQKVFEFKLDLTSQFEANEVSSYLF